jgi:hypothetical protein
MLLHPEAQQRDETNVPLRSSRSQILLAGCYRQQWLAATDSNGWLLLTAMAGCY